MFWKRKQKPVIPVSTDRLGPDKSEEVVIKLFGEKIEICRQDVVRVHFRSNDLKSSIICTQEQSKRFPIGKTLEFILRD